MWERQAVINVALIVGLAAVPVGAQAKAHHRSVRPETVGDLLQSIESHTKTVDLKKKRSQLPKFKAQSHAQSHHTAINFREIKPPSKSKFYYKPGTDEAKLEQVTDEGIHQLYRLTRQFRNSPRRGELWLRLAEQYVEKSHLIEYKLESEFDARLEAYEKGKTKRKPRLDLKASQVYNRKAIQLYEWYLRDFPKGEKVDQALFFLGYNYFELNQEKKGEGYYEQLTKRFPKSPYVDESNFALGEYYFNREKWKQALHHYQHISHNRRARLYSFALYKSAWCQYKLGQVKPALHSLQRVIRVGRIAKGHDNGSATGVSKIRLASEAQKDLVAFYAEAGDAAHAQAYFEDVVGEKHTPAMLEKLAYYYVDTGNRKGAGELFKQLIDSHPTTPKAFDYQYQIVNMYSTQLNTGAFRSALSDWLNNFGPDSDWYRANRKNKELVGKSEQLMETTLRNHILQEHQTAQNSHAPYSQKMAKQGYELYFQTFKSGDHLDEMHFFYGELLFDMGEYPKAAVHYNWVAENAPKSQYAQKAYLNTVLALEKDLPSEKDLKKRVGNSLDPVPLESNVKAFIQASSRYMNAYPKGDNVSAILFKDGALYYYHNQFDDALANFNTIINKYPKSEYAAQSANLTLDIYNLKKDYAGLEKAGQRILQVKDLAKSQVGHQVKGILQRVSFKKAQKLESGKDYAGAAQAFEAFGRKNQGSNLSFSAFYNAGVDYEKAGNSRKAIEMYSLVHRAHVKNKKLKDNASRFLAHLYEQTGQYAKAAVAFENYAHENARDKEAANYYYNAAVIRDGMNEYSKAIRNYETYMKKSRASDRKESLFLLAKMWERRGNVSQTLHYYEQYYYAHPRNPSSLVETLFKIAKLYEKKHKTKDADKWYRRTVAVQRKLSSKNKPVGVRFAAEAKFKLVSKYFDDLRSIHIPRNPKKQGAAVQKKLAILNRLKDALKDVIKYNDAFTLVSSMTLLGQAQQHMATAIAAVPAPKGLSKDDLKKYKAGVDKVVKPFQDDAVKSYQTAIQRGYNLDGYNQWLKTAQKEINDLNSGFYQDYGENVVLTKAADPLTGHSVEDQSDKVKPLIETMRKAFAGKDESALVDAASRVLGEDSKNLIALDTMAVHYLNRGDAGLAKILINRALADHPDEPALHNNLGVIYLSEDRLGAALASFRKAIELDKAYPYAAANLGSIYLEYKNYEKAVPALAGAYEALDSGLGRGSAVSREIAENYAIALGATGDMDKAKSIFETLLKADAKDVPTLLNYAILLVERMKDKKDGGKIVTRLKFLADDGPIQKKIRKLESELSGT